MNYYDTFYKKLYTSVKSTLEGIGLPEVEVWYGRYDALEPSKTYCMMHLLEISDLGLSTEGHHYEKEDDNFINTVVTVLSSYVQFSIVGEDSAFVASRLRHNILYNKKYRDVFLTNELGITTRSSLRRVPQKLDTGWMDAYNFDISFTFSFVWEENKVDYFDEVQIGGIVYPPTRKVDIRV